MEEETEKPINQDAIRDSKGQFRKGQSGNPKGIGAGRKRIKELDEALARAAKAKDKTFLMHFVERAYKSDPVAIALAKKILPDKLDVESESLGNLAQALLKLDEQRTNNT